MKITILGCGSSTGTPMIGCECFVCTSDDPKNKRRRASIFVEVNGVNILVDTSPDLRMQALENNITRIDAILYTHMHGDHTHGIDDLRRFTAIKKDFLDVYADSRTIAGLRARFPYVFKRPIVEYGWYHAAINPHEICAGEVFSIDNVKILPFSQVHGNMESLGFRIGNFAYSTDLNDLPEESYGALSGVKVWVVDCQSYKKNYTHSWLNRTLEWIEKVQPDRAILTHMGHRMEYEKLLRELPKKIVPAFDNMVVDNID